MPIYVRLDEKLHERRMTLTELAARVGLLDRYLEAIDRGSGTTVPLKGPAWDYSFATSGPAAASAIPRSEPASPGRDERGGVWGAMSGPPTSEQIWDRVCRAATRSLTGGAVEHDLDWFRRHGAFFVPFPQTRYYLHTAMVAKGLRYELPYQERIKRVGAELGARLRERGITWWDAQLDEYQPLPSWKDFPAIWRGTVSAAGRSQAEYPLWLLTSGWMQYSWGSNV